LPVSHSLRTLSHLADDGNRQEDARKHAGMVQSPPAPWLFTLSADFHSPPT
jgi:hypothetical protein